MTVNDDTIELDVPAMIINDRTLVPVRAISEAYGCKVEWAADTKTVVIESAVAPTEVPASTEAPTATEAPAPAPTKAPDAAAEPTATPEPLTAAFADKSICLFGDDTVGKSKVWAEQVKLSLAPQSFVSVNAGRRRMVLATGKDIAAEDLLAKVPQDCDYILVMAGLAEWILNLDGYSTSGSQNSLEEGLDNVYFNLHRRAPKAEIIFVTQPYMTARADSLDAYGIYNGKGLSPLEMCEVTKYMAGNLNIPVIDLYNECGWGADNYKDYMLESGGSYIYPNEEGSKVIAEIVTKRLMEINPEDNQ